MRKIKAGEGILRIGKNGEQEALGVFFPVVKNWEGLYGTGGTWELSVQRAGDEMAYSAEIDTDAENVRWIVSDVDVSKIGEGRCELVYRLGGTIAKSRTYAFVVEKSLTGGAELPDPVKDWKDGIEKAIDEKIDRPAGGEIGDVLTKTEDGEEWKPGGSEDAVQYVPQELTEAQQKQARGNIGVINGDWNQNDKTKADYIKNRGAYQYSEKQIKSEDFISGNHINGEIVAIPDENDKFLKSIQTYDELFGSMPWIGYTQALEIYCDVTTNGYSFTEKGLDYFNPQKYEPIGGSNRKISNTKGIVVYFILDISTLNDEYAGKFAKNGIYGSYDKSKDSNNTTKLSYIIKLTYQYMWKEKFIPSEIERSTRKVTDISQWSGRDDFYPSVSAVEKYINGKLESAGSDISLGLTSAEVGQIAKITAVDSAGKPTVWEAVDMPSGGGNSQFRLIRKVIIPEDITTDTSGVNFAAQSNGGAWFGFDKDENGESFECTELLIASYAGGNSDNQTFTVRINNAIPAYGTGGDVSVHIEVGKNGRKIYSISYSCILNTGESISWGASFGGGGNNNVNTTAKILVANNNGDTKISKIVAYAKNNDNYGFLAGSWFVFYGR